LGTGKDSHARRHIIRRKEPITKLEKKRTIGGGRETVGKNYSEEKGRPTAFQGAWGRKSPNSEKQDGTVVPVKKEAKKSGN